VVRAALRRGDVVEVKSPHEILTTLDDRGTLDGLPFMPEMLQYCGRRFRVEKRADKLCDMIYPLGSRALPNAVLLDDLRCDGSGHDGCQAECRIFWNQAWLVRVTTGQTARTPESEAAPHELVERLASASRSTIQTDAKARLQYTCQATEMHRATQPLGRWDPRPLLREYRSGNVDLGTFLRVMLRAATVEPLRVLGLRPKAPLRGSGATGARQPSLGLQPGESVHVKTREEIAETLNEQGFNRGLWFDEEMLPYCGGTYRVRQRINRFVDEHTGRMIELKAGDCVTLDGVVCSGEHSPVRWFCPRASYPYWRESWLHRAGPSTSAPSEPLPAALEPEPRVDAVFHHPAPTTDDRGTAR
jgi:hypothetical protein